LTRPTIKKIRPRNVRKKPLKNPVKPTPSFPKPGKEATAYCPSLNSLPAHTTWYEEPGLVSNEYTNVKVSAPEPISAVLPVEGSANETLLPFSSLPSQTTSAEVETTTPVEDAASKLVVSPRATVDAPVRISVNEVPKLTQLRPPTPQLDSASRSKTIPVMSEALGGRAVAEVRGSADAPA
jgi:hypothetical protein